MCTRIFGKLSGYGAAGGLWLLAALLFSGCEGTSSPEYPEAMPREEKYLYAPFPDASIQTAEGIRSLSSLWREKPILFSLVYTRCAGVCYPFVHSLKKALQAVDGLGRDFRVVVVSFDPRDRLHDMQAMARRLSLHQNRDWIFGVTQAETINRLAASIGYWRRWQPDIQQYDHPAMLVGIRRDGRIARFLIGGTVSAVRLYEVVRELRGEFIAAYPLPRKNVIFSCFQYDPEKGMVFDWGFLILLLPGFVTFGGTGWLFWRGRKFRQ